jgi:hypothetical protein
MCNCSPNSTCDCNDYRVTTGPQGNTGPQGPQGPAGPPGNRTYLYSVAYTTSQPASNGTANQTLGSYVLPANTLSNNYDAILISAGFIPTFNSNSKTLKVNFGGYTFEVTTALPYWVFTGSPVIKLELLIIRTNSSAQLIDTLALYPVGSATKWVENGSVNLTSNVTISATCTTGTANDVLLSYFTIEKIKYDV